MNVADDAALAAAAFIMDYLAILPADRGRCELFFFEVIKSAVEAALKDDRGRRACVGAEPSAN
jgi:hypothetical protein